MQSITTERFIVLGILPDRNNPVFYTVYDNFSGAYINERFNVSSVYAALQLVQEHGTTIFPNWCGDEIRFRSERSQRPSQPDDESRVPTSRSYKPVHGGYPGVVAKETQPSPREMYETFCETVDNGVDRNARY